MCMCTYLYIYMLLRYLSTHIFGLPLSTMCFSFYVRSHISVAMLAGMQFLTVNRTPMACLPRFSKDLWMMASRLDKSVDVVRTL